MRLFDTHSHIHFPEYDADRELVLQRMREQGIATVTIGTTLGSSRRGIAFAERHENIWCTVGYHPEHFSSAFVAPGEEDKDIYSIDELRKIAMSSPKVVGIGETGLDFFRIDEGIDREEAKRRQEQGFRDQIRLAAELDKTLVIHSRDAFDRLSDILREESSAGRKSRTIIHCFSGSWADAQPLLELGCYLSVAGVITFPPKKTQDPEMHVHRVLERMPADRILIETDAPYLTPVPHRGERNEPAHVEFVARKIAELRGVTFEEIALQTTENAKRAFAV